MSERREDDYEVSHAGKSLTDVEAHRIGCIAERGTFLSPDPYVVQRKHPYEFNAALRGRLKAVDQVVPAYGVHATPYFWLNRDNLTAVLRDFDVAYEAEREEAVDEALGFSPEWVIHGDNQQALIERFFADVSATGGSLIFFYAKHSPLDGSRTDGPLLVGAASITDLELPGYWPTDGATAFPNYMWETTVRHSLRPEGHGGILLPVAELARRDAEGEDVADALAWAPATGGREFAYVTEHVSHDRAISALERLFTAAMRCRELGIEVPQRSLDWVSERIGEMWTMRGPAPGLGAVLSALTVPYGQVVARVIARHTPEDTDPWDVFQAAVENPSAIPEVREWIPQTLTLVWRQLDDERISALKLLSRFQLTSEQAAALFTRDTELEFEFRDLLEDPYLAHICTANGRTPVPFDVVDRGCFPSAAIRARFPVSESSAMTDRSDERRIQALLVDLLERRAAKGDTLLPLPDALDSVKEMPLTEECPVTEPILSAHGLHPDQLPYDPDNPFWPPIVGTKLQDGTPAFKLSRLESVARLIRDTVKSRLAQPRMVVPDGLENVLDDVLPDHSPDSADDEDAEARARREKKAALAEMYAAPLSVLNGRAGTGKTTLIKALVAQKEVRDRGVLLLAPTGKARVQLQTKVEHPAQTIAQFLSKHGRYDAKTGTYLVKDRPIAPRYGTVVVDESSMLTEEQFASLLSALGSPDRLILVGDPRQLPPIGAGRPFVDLITKLTEDADVPRFPKVGEGYAELTELRRQKGGEVRDDLKLAAWFSGDELPQGYEEVWHRLRAGTEMETLAAVPWDSLRPTEVVDRTLASELGVSPGAPSAFERSYGGRLNGKWVTFPKGKGGAAESSENWQILSPVRGHAWGTTEVNRHLKRKHRSRALQEALLPNWKRTTPKPIGPEQIVLGDKVLNNVNGRCKPYPPESGLGYVANGEIGVVVGQVGKQGTQPRWTNVEFSSQLGATYGYRGEGDDNPTLELAWAITIHKSQGSEFGKVFVLLPRATRSLSREMLYTALTRQKDRVVLMHEGPLDDLLDLSISTGSETARRLTDLFFPPDPLPVQFPDGTPTGRLDRRLIHAAANGVLVRSKNEVIVANILEKLVPGRWQYEHPLTLNGKTLRPDFTIVAPDGRTLYWEHLGMLQKESYRESWQRKEDWYRSGGVLPHEEGGGPQGTLICTNDLNGVDVDGWTEQARAAIGPIAPPVPIPTKKKVVRRKKPD
ncbi:ATP-dependent RecD-like DNA helicase [Actinomadura miaoliensis]|uniref:ATP-dependent RecD-like DNA helicase n=1 Tax=Actinomadura miaoliensis TaxID=430685 RepID=UPI0031E4F157